MPGGAKGSSGKSGAGKASPAALFEDDERSKNWKAFRRKKRPNQIISYDKSPSPPRK